MWRHNHRFDYFFSLRAPLWTEDCTSSMKNKNVSTIKPFCNFSYSPNLKQASGPGKPIIAYPGLNIANRGINFIPRLHFVPESTIKTNLGTNYVLTLTHLARTINSLIGGKSLSKQTKLQTYRFTNTRKLQQREIDLDQLTDEEIRSRYRFDRESIKCLWQTRRNHALSPIFRAIFFQKQVVEKLVKPVF